MPLEPEHADYAILKPIYDGILGRVGGLDELCSSLPGIVRSAVEFVIDPIHTARTRIEDLDNVEKTFIGLKIEHFFRDYIDLPKGVRDLRIDGVDLDVKNTVGATWMIPPETYRVSEPVLLVSTAVADQACSLGLLVARPEYLNKPNRDGKRSVRASAKLNIWWLVRNQPLPKSHWAGLDMLRFRELREIRGGARRAAMFFAENLLVPMHRQIVVALLHDQDDPMKRLRENGGARDHLRPLGIELLSGTYDQARCIELGLPVIERDEFISVRSADEIP